MSADEPEAPASTQVTAEEPVQQVRKAWDLWEEPSHTGSFGRRRLAAQGGRETPFQVCRVLGPSRYPINRGRWENLGFQGLLGEQGFSSLKLPGSPRQIIHVSAGSLRVLLLRKSVSIWTSSSQFK